MYCAVKSRVKLGNKLGDAFECSLGVRQGESLSPFLFSMFLNDIEDVFMNTMIVYADDIVVFDESKDEFQRSLDVLLEYCNHWKLVVNTRNKLK